MPVSPVSLKLRLEKTFSSLCGVIIVQREGGFGATLLLEIGKVAISVFPAVSNDAFHSRWANNLQS